MNNINVGIIGHFGGNNNFTDGQTVKTKEIYNYLSTHTKFVIRKVDTYKIKTKFLTKIFAISKLIKESDAIVLIVSTRGYKILLPIIDFLNKKKNARLYDFVIGGSRYNVYSNNNKLVSLAKKYSKIYVETSAMLDEYGKYGFDNVEVMSNFKNIESYPPKKYNKEAKQEIKICTFSRVCKEKGISDAIEVIKELNKTDETKTYKLDIYGNIENDYNIEFSELLKENSKYVSYCGVVSFNNSSQIIKEYDMLLFLTYWPGEGMPGTLIDCFFASTPVIATNWNYNFNILEDNKTGIKVEVGQIDEIVDKTKKLANNLDLLEQMSCNCYKEREKYLPEIIIKPFIRELEGENET